jgi:hypothetical protein
MQDVGKIAQAGAQRLLCAAGAADFSGVLPCAGGVMDVRGRRH